MSIIKCENCNKWVHYNGTSNHKCDNCYKNNLYNGSMIIYDLYRKQQELIDSLNKQLTDLTIKFGEEFNRRTDNAYMLKNVVKELNDKEILNETKSDDIKIY